jgi:hypothetical protein
VAECSGAERVAERVAGERLVAERVVAERVVAERVAEGGGKQGAEQRAELEAERGQSK